MRGSDIWHCLARRKLRKVVPLAISPPMPPGHAGPCISTDTACSSSLVATHLAHKGLLLGESSAAVASGSNIMLSASTTAAICQLQVGLSNGLAYAPYTQLTYTLSFCMCFQS